MKNIPIPFQYNKFQAQSFKPQSIGQNQNQLITPQKNDQSFQNCNYYNILQRPSSQLMQKIKKDEIKIETELTQEEMQFLQQVCNANVEHCKYFKQANEKYQQCNKGQIGLSIKDFDPQFNMSQKYYSQESEERGPNNHKYSYFFPKTCLCYGLKVKKYENDNWLKMDGNQDEWRILYHGTKQEFVVAIVKNGLKAGTGQTYKDEICRFTNQKVGEGIYFSDRIECCRSYCTPITVGDKKINVYVMSRVRPSAIRQSVEMQKNNYFVVNNSGDVRPYRVLLEEV